jgi:hypothetical protein
MPEVVILLLAACGTALATGLGAVPVFLLGTRAAALAPALLGFSARLALDDGAISKTGDSRFESWLPRLKLACEAEDAALPGECRDAECAVWNRAFGGPAGVNCANRRPSHPPGHSPRSSLDRWL